MNASNSNKKATKTVCTNHFACVDNVDERISWPWRLARIVEGQMTSLDHSLADGPIRRRSAQAGHTTKELRVAIVVMQVSNLLL
jgi:hypothetical protein